MTTIAKQSKGLRNNFLANMSHEIKTPLNTIIGATHLLKAMTDDSEILEVVGNIKKSSESLQRLTNDLLDFNKLEMGELVLDHLNFNLRSEVYEVVDHFRKLMDDKQLVFKLNLDPALPEYVTGDSLRLKQILFNIVDNAVKFTQEGSISFEIRQIENSRNRHQIEFVIHDTGIGIPVEHQDNIWKAFSMEDDSLTRRTGGSGLGLAVTRQLCQLMGGDISMKSIVNKGTSFTVAISFKAGITPKLVSSPASETSNILLVEDNHINQKITMSLLKNEGYQMSVACNGVEAVEKFKEEEFHLILMDVQMPVMDGIEAAKTIRKIENETSAENPVKIIALTANTHKEDRERCLDAGMDDYISKPFNVSKLPLILGSIKARA